MILIQNFMLKKKPKMYQLTPGNSENNLLISEADVLLLSNTDEELSITKNEDGKKREYSSI